MRSRISRPTSRTIPSLPSISGGWLKAMRAIGPNAYCPSRAGKIAAMLSRMVGAFAIGSSRKQDRVERSRIEHVAQRVGVHRPVDADHSTEPGEEKSVAERNDEVAENGGDKREPGSSAGKLRIQNRERGEPERFERERERTSILVVENGEKPPALDGRGFERNRIGRRELEAEGDVVLTERSLVVGDQRDRETESFDKA